jgi:hypothetical protein
MHFGVEVSNILHPRTKSGQHSAKVCLSLQTTILTYANQLLSPTHDFCLVIMPSRQQRLLRRLRLSNQHQFVRRQADSNRVKRQNFFADHVDRENVSLFDMCLLYFIGNGSFKAINR